MNKLAWVWVMGIAACGGAGDRGAGRGEHGAPVVNQDQDQGQGQGQGQDQSQSPSQSQNPSQSQSPNPGSTGGAGAAVLPDDNRPTGVTFDWPETDPAAGGACKPGHYVGEYSCRLYIVATNGPGAFDVSGTIDMQLEQTPDGELLRIANGVFSSDTLAAIPMHADIVGELHCSTSRFEGSLENGTFSVALDLPVPFTEGTFSGPLNADYDKSAAQLANGAWNMTGELDLVPGSCMDGTWSAQWVGD